MGVIILKITQPAAAGAAHICTRTETSLHFPRASIYVIRGKANADNCVDCLGFAADCGAADLAVQFRVADSG
jgi:hypothetical protein